MITTLWVRHNAIALENNLNLCPTMQYRLISNYDAVEALWSQLLRYHLKVSTDQHPVLLSDPMYKPKVPRERSAEIIFGTSHVSRVQLVSQPEISIFGSARTTRVILDSGHDITHSAPVYDGLSLIR